MARAATWTRAVVAGPVAILAALAVTFGMPIWWPSGRAGINNLVLPLILLPAIWAVAFFYACLDRRLARAAIVLCVVAVLNGGLIAWRLGIIGG